MANQVTKAEALKIVEKSAKRYDLSDEEDRTNFRVDLRLRFHITRVSVIRGGRKHSARRVSR